MQPEGFCLFYYFFDLAVKKIYVAAQNINVHFLAFRNKFVTAEFFEINFFILKIFFYFFQSVKPHFDDVKHFFFSEFQYVCNQFRNTSKTSKTCVAGTCTRGNNASFNNQYLKFWMFAF